MMIMTAFPMCTSEIRNHQHVPHMLITSSEGFIPVNITPTPQVPDRNLALELVRVTEAGALASARWVGRGEKERGDGAAVDAMRSMLNTVAMRGVVVIGEGEKD